MSSFILPIFITYGLKSGAFITYYIYDFHLLTLPDYALVGTSFVTHDSYYEVYKYSEK